MNPLVLSFKKIEPDRLNKTNRGNSMSFIDTEEDHREKNEKINKLKSFVKNLNTQKYTFFEKGKYTKENLQLQKEFVAFRNEIIANLVRSGLKKTVIGEIFNLTYQTVSLAYQKNLKEKEKQSTKIQYIKTLKRSIKHLQAFTKIKEEELWIQ